MIFSGCWNQPGKEQSFVFDSSYFKTKAIIWGLREKIEEVGSWKLEQKKTIKGRKCTKPNQICTHLVWFFVFSRKSNV